MNILRGVCFMAVASLLAGSMANAGQLLYLAASRDKAIVAYDINAETGELSRRFEVELPGNPGPLAYSPQRDFIYAEVSGLEEKKSGIVTLKRAPDGTLTVAGTSFITDRAPYIRTDRDGKLLLAAHYGSGEVTVYRITDGICTSELLDRVMTEKTAHCIELDPSGRFVFVPHTTPNKVYQFALNAGAGKLQPADPPFVEGPDEDHLYHQPRHYAHHPTLKMAYTSNERGGGITAWSFDPDKGTLSRQQTLSTLPPDFGGNSAAADIHITPNGRFVYVSNRDVTRREDGQPHQDTIAGFRIDQETGLLTRIGFQKCGQLPRSFCIDESGRFLYAAGQQSSTLAACRINQETGELSLIADYEVGNVPIWVMCGNVAR